MSVNGDQIYPHEWRISTLTPTKSMSKLANISEVSDQDVVAWAREGDEDAYREMLRRVRPSASADPVRRV